MRDFKKLTDETDKKEIENERKQYFSSWNRFWLCVSDDTVLVSQCIYFVGDTARYFKLVLCYLFCLYEVLTMKYEHKANETDKKAIEDNHRLALIRKQRKAMIIYGIENEPDMIWTKMVMPCDLVVKPKLFIV